MGWELEQLRPNEKVFFIRPYGNTIIAFGR
jgi:hypothetical protein